jgi:HlyD family secretion protein
MRPDRRPGGAGVYVLVDGKPIRVSVRPGVTDGTYTAIESDSLREGMSVIVGTRGPSGSAQQQGAVNPFAPGGMGRGGRR